MEDPYGEGVEFVGPGGVEKVVLVLGVLLIVAAVGIVTVRFLL